MADNKYTSTHTGQEIDDAVDNVSQHGDRLNALETFMSTTQPAKDSTQDAAISLLNALTSHEDKGNTALDTRVTALESALAGKQDTLTFDDAPTSGSNNPVKSGGIFTALAAKADASDVYTKTQSDERYLVEVKTPQTADAQYDDYYITTGSDGSTQPSGSIAADTQGAGNFTLLLFEVQQGEEWVVRRAAGAATGGRLCALYSCDTAAEVIASTTAANVVAGYTSWNLYKTTEVVKEYTKGDKIPATAKWLVVTKYKTATIVVSKVSRTNATERIDALDTRLTTNETLDITQNDRLTVLESSSTSYGSRLTAVEGKNTTQDARLATLERAGLVSNEDALTPDHTLDNYAIVQTTSDQQHPQFSAYNGGSNFKLLGYDVEEGDIVEIKLTSNSATSGWSRVYAFYALTALANNGTPLLSAETRVDAGETARAWANGVVFDDTVTVPAGATMLVVTQVTTLASYLTVKSLTPQGAVDLFPRVAALEADVVALAEDIDDIEDAVNTYDYSEAEQASTGIDYTVRTGGTGYGLGTNGAISASDWVQSGKSEYGYQLMVYEVSAGERWRIKRDGSTGTNYKAWSFFAAESAQDVLTATLVATSTQTLSSKGTFDVTVPAGANLLVVSRVTSIATPVVSKGTATPLSSTVASLGTRVTAVEASDALQNIDGKLSVIRYGEFIGVAYNRGDGKELCYRLCRCYTSGNNTMGFGGAGYRNVTRRHSDATNVYKWNSGGGVTTLELASSTDIISPISYQGYADFIGGAHVLNYASGVSASTTPTTQTTSWSVIADDTAVADGDSVYCNSVTLTVTNKIRRPADSVLNTGGKVTEAQTYSDLIPFCEETQEITIRNDGSVTVRVTLDFEDDSVGKVLKTYYGMQSTFHCTSMLTIGGAYSKFTNYTGVSSFTKAAYPRFDRIVEARAGWLQSAWLRPDVGIGDHRYLADNDVIFQRAGNETNRAGKYYHSLIGADKALAITSGLTMDWEGVYTWIPNEGAAMEAVEMATACASYTREESDARYYTKAEIDAMFEALND